MKILYDHQIFYWQKYGGISRYFYELISRVIKYDDCIVDMFQGFNNNGYNLSNCEYDFNRYFSAEKRSFPKTERLYQLINKYGLYLFGLNKKYKIYHPTYYNYYKPLNAHMIVTVYDMIHEIYYKDSNDTTIRKKRMVDAADGIIAISQQTKQDLINIFGVKEEKIQVIYLANSLKYKVTDAPVFGQPYILYVGNRDGYKNFLTLLRAMAVTSVKKDIFLVCFGGGPLRKNEKELIQKLGLDGRVFQYTGDDYILANLYKNAKAFIYPSKYEGFGIPPLEAMYYETPVIVSNTSSIPEVVGDAGLYFSPLEYEDLANKIAAVCEDTLLRKNLVSKGLAREQIFCWDACACQTINYYKKVVDDGDKK